MNLLKIFEIHLLRIIMTISFLYGIFQYMILKVLELWIQQLFFRRALSQFQLLFKFAKRHIFFLIFMIFNSFFDIV